MTDHPNRPPQFHDFPPLDPLSAASGRPGRPSLPKRKAGFYLEEELIDRFDRAFHRLKLDGVAVDNKSALLEALVRFGLDDLDRGADSQVRRNWP